MLWRRRSCPCSEHIPLHGGMRRLCSVAQAGVNASVEAVVLAMAVATDMKGVHHKAGEPSRATSSAVQVCPDRLLAIRLRKHKLK